MTLVIINPRSGGGRTGRQTQLITEKLRQALGDLRVVTTAGPMHGARLAHEGLLAGHELVVAVGGDGTVDEVVNGFFDNGANIAPKAQFGFLMVGAGSDFRKTFGIGEGIDAGMARLASATPRALDIGRLTYTSLSGETRERYFNNVAGFGLSGEVARSTENARLTKLFGGKFAFTVNSLLSILRYENKRVHVAIDDVFDDVVDVSLVAICNGQYFGAGMHIAPDASPNDGLFDVVVMAGGTKRELIAGINEIYSGTHLQNPKVRVVRGRKLTARPLSDGLVLIDSDGEQPGYLPATFEILPRALNVRC